MPRFYDKIDSLLVNRNQEHRVFTFVYHREEWPLPTVRYGAYTTTQYAKRDTQLALYHEAIRKIHHFRI